MKGNVVSYIVELSLNGQSRHVILQVKLMSHVCAIQYKVESESKRFCPVLLASADKVISTKLQCISFLVWAMRQSPNFSTKSLCPHQSKVAKSPNTDNGNLLSRSGICTDERRIGGQTSTHHRASFFRFDLFGNGEDELLMGTCVRGVSAVSMDLIAVFIVHGLVAAAFIEHVPRAVCIDLLWATCFSR